MNNATAAQSKPNGRSSLELAGRMCLWILGLLLLATGIALRMSVMTGSVRAVVAATLIFAVFTGFVHLARLFQAQPKTLYPAIFILALTVLWATLGSKPPDMAGLRSGYIKELKAHVGRKYVWGGETGAGIDCSGLARAALWQAMLKEGIRQFNPRLLGLTLWKFWWRDMSVRDMAESRYGYTVKLGTAPKLAGNDCSGYQPGDLALVGEYHVLIYLGQDEWIEANPDDGKVAVNISDASSKRPYFNARVTRMRWWILRD
jgi:hypothetical protein